MDHTSPLKKRVIQIVSIIPFGKVVSYGQVALYIGSPRAAREVGWTLNRLEGHVELPWWRVINNTGRITIKGSHFSADIQKKLLESEGIDISKDLTLAIENYRWKPNQKQLANFELDKEYLSIITEKYKHYYESK